MAHVSSSKPGPDTVYHEAGSQAAIDDLIQAQDRARARNQSALSKWAPWLIGGLVVGGAIYFLKKD